MPNFKQSQFFGDVNWLEHGGTWAAHNQDDHWYIREIRNNEVEIAKYTVALSEIYTDNMMSEIRDKDVMNFTGLTPEEWSELPTWEKVLMYYQYGYSDLIRVALGNNYKALFKSIRRNM